MKTVLITGSTGMIGSLVLEHCLQSEEVSRVISLVRRSSITEDPKLEEVVIEDFLDLDEEAEYWDSVDVVYYCLGVYTGAVDKELFRQITIDYPEALATLLRKKSPDLVFCLLSGAGADRSETSRMMFARDKGSIENKLSKMGFKSFFTFRPGYIYPVTPRTEPNFSYTVMRFLYPVIRLMGKNSSIKSTDLAAAMVEVGLHGSDGSDLEIFENKDILELASAREIG